MIDHQKLIERLEGKREHAYKDTEGNITIGIGFNLSEPANERLFNRLILPKIDATYEEIANGEKPLQDFYIDILLAHTWLKATGKALNRATKLNISFYDLPEWHRFILIDIAFNTGSVKYWSKVFKEKEPKKVLYEARRRPHEIMDSRVCKIAHYFGFADTIDDCKALGLEHSKYVV